MVAIVLFQDVNMTAVASCTTILWSPTKRGLGKNKENTIERNKMKACKDK